MLRIKLNEMTKVLDVSKHPHLLAELSTNYNNSIQLLQSEHSINHYTCLMHVLGFINKQEYIDVASLGLPDVYAGRKFAHWLIDNKKIIEIPKCDAITDDIIFYFLNSKFTHTGILNKNNRVISKWGEGHLYDHEIFEVPESYGESVRFFKPLSYDDAYYYFAQFSEENGVPFEW